MRQAILKLAEPVQDSRLAFKQPTEFARLIAMAWKPLKPGSLGQQIWRIRSGVTGLGLQPATHSVHVMPFSISTISGGWSITSAIMAATFSPPSGLIGRLPTSFFSSGLL